VTVLVLSFSPCARGAKVEFTPYEPVKAVLASYAGRLPAELVDPSPVKWNAWNRRNDQAIRSRLERGELDSMVNLLLYGTSFTSRPRIGISDLAEQARSGLLKLRVSDLVRGLATPGNNERLTILGELMRQKGIEPGTRDGDEKAGVFILDNLRRVLEEKRSFAARSAERAGSILDERSELFRDRGVSLDTGILADFSIDIALQRLKQNGALRPGQVTRVLVVGPGLNFIDKDELAAFDYFPLQTLQPFALIDSLLQLDVASSGHLSLTAFDISPLVIAHLQHARQQAEKKNGYEIQLPQDAARPWPSGLENYWKRLGDRAGMDVKPLPAPGLFPGLRTRAIRIRPEIVQHCEIADLDIVAQRLDLASNNRYDLVVATNVFLYYDEFQQTLALQNIVSMMTPGGLLLSNDKLPLLPLSGVDFLGVTAISDGGSGRDAIAAYRKQ
jgi:hypothetical protein